MQNRNPPLVSILIPVYNREKIVSETLDSALGQTYENIEIIVVDNASTDETWEILTKYADTNRRIKIFRSPINIGPVKNWKACMEKASGEYGKILWSDDLIAPNYVEMTLPYMLNPDVGFTFTRVEIFDNEKRLDAYSIGDTGIYDSMDFIKGTLLGGGYPRSPGAAIFRLKDLNTNLLMDIPNKLHLDFPTNAIGNDLLIYLITAAQYPKFAFVDMPLSFFRFHKDSISVNSKQGKLELFYQVASAFFVEKYVKDSTLVEKFNANLLITKFFKGVKIKKIDDFYPATANRAVDWFFFVSRIIRRFLPNLLRILKMRTAHE